MRTRLHPPAEADQRFGYLVGAVRAVTQRRLGWETTADLVADRLRAYWPSPDILTSEQRYGDPLSYRCHELHTESDGSFSIVALVWQPGQATPVHDHVTWCVAGVIQGAEHEQRYVLRDDGWLEESSESVNVVGDVVGLAPPGDIHRVFNRGADTAISIHVYGTDVSRLGSSVRRVYDLPVVAAAGDSAAGTGPRLDRGSGRSRSGDPRALGG